jgi:multisubunit Na+/H+ antiporter MnhB subunit
MFASAIAIFAGLQSSRRTRRLLTLLVGILWLIQAITQSLDPQLSLIAFVAAALTTLVVRVSHRFQSNLWVKSSRRASAQWIRAIGVGTAFIAALLLASQGLLSTLQLGASDNAVYNSPTATRIKRGGEATVMENNSVADYQRITQTLKVFPVRKISATVREGALKSAPTLLVGVDPQVWKLVPDIRHQTILDLRSTGALLSEPKARFGVDASSANFFDVKVSGLHPNTYLSVWVLNSSSESELVRLNPNGQRLSARLPDGTDRILGFEITEFPDFKDRREHAVGEGINGLKVPTGSITLASLQLDGQMVEGPAIDQQKYSLINGPVFLSLVDLPMSIPAIVDEDTGALAEGGTVWVNIGVDTAVALNVVGRSHNLPTVPMRFALLNPNVLTQLLAATHPEMIRVSEIWSTQSPLNSPENRKSLDGLSILSRSDVLINNHTPTTARWTQRGFGLLWTSLVLMYIVLVIFAATAIFSDPQILGWHGAGVSLQHITRALAVFVFAQVCIGLVAAFAIVKMFLPLLVTLQTYDLNGVAAYPSLVVQWNWFEILASCAGVVLISIFAIQIAVQRTRVVGRVEK